MVYSWKYAQGIPADVAGKRFEELEQTHGAITPAIIVEDARGEESPLHPAFEWDDAKAAEQYRLKQAGTMLRALVVTVEEAEKPKPTRAYVNISEVSEKQGRFIAVGRALSHEDTRQIVLMHALMELSQFRRKYADVEELADLFAAIERLKVA